MKIRSLLIVAIAALVMLGGLPLAASANTASTGPVVGPDGGRVLIVSVPRLTWDVVSDVRPPAMISLFERAAVASMSVRTASSTTRPADAYLTIGAGNRMAVPATLASGEVLDRDETMWDRDPTEAYQRTTGFTADKPIVSINKPQLDRFNDDEYFFGAHAGALASALSEGDRTMAVIGNADVALLDSYRRHVGLAAMNRDGQVDDGMVDRSLLRANPELPFGIEIDPQVHAASFERLWAENDVVRAELSDLARAEQAREVSTEAQGDAQYERALLNSDALLGSMLRHVDPERDTVILLSGVAPLEQLELTVFAAAGPDFERGWARSSTTRRDRFVTLTDIAPSILSLYDIDAPSGMNDTRIASSPASIDLDAQLDTLIDDSARAVVRDRTFGPISVVFVVVLVFTIVAAMLCLAWFPKLNRYIWAATVAELAFLPATYLLGLFGVTTVSSLVLGLLLGTVSLALLAWTTKRVDGRAPALLLVALLWGVLAVDIATGGNLQLNTVFGYSPIVAGRFAGFGNQAYSMFAISSLIVAAAFADARTPDSRGRATAATVAAIAVWTALALVLDGHPSMGSDVGGVLSIVPAATVFILMLRRIRIDAKLVVVIGVATVAVLAGFAALDMSRPAESQTHLGRFVADLFDGGAGTIIQRKIAANLRVLTSVWAWVIPASLGYFCYIIWRPNRTFARLGERHRSYRAFGVGALTLGFMSMAVNDSGVSLPAIMVAIVSAYTINLVMDMERSTPQGGRPNG